MYVHIFTKTLFHNYGSMMSKITNQINSLVKVQNVQHQENEK